jgi:hypothetical protein
MNFISADINLALMVQLSLPYHSTGRARVEYNFILVFPLTLLGLRMLSIIMLRIKVIITKLEK